MKIQGNLTKPAELQRLHQTQQYTAPQPSKSETLSRRFDSVTISGENGGKYHSFERELHSRLSQEVRTATTSGMVAALREQVQSGAYQPDATEIARKMLLLGEAG